MFSVTVGPWLPQHAQMSLKPPRTHAAQGKVALGTQQQMEEALPGDFLQFAGAQLPIPQPQSGETVLQLLHPSQEIPATAKFWFLQPS